MLKRQITEVFFVSSVKTDEQVKYGISNDKKYFVKSDNPNPLVLADAGYYEISVNLLEGTYSVEKLATPESKYGEMYFVYGWADYPAMTQIDAKNCPARWTIDYDLKNGRLRGRIRKRWRTVDCSGRKRQLSSGSMA